MASTKLVSRPDTRSGSKIFPRVLEVPAARPEATRLYYQNKLEYETDPSDVHEDMENGIDGFIVVDARSRESFERSHVPRAVSIPYRTIDEGSTRNLSKNNALVVYCWGPGCNAATKAAVRLASLGFQVKEMIGGIEYWRREGYALEGSNPSETGEQEE